LLSFATLANLSRPPAAGHEARPPWFKWRVRRVQAPDVAVSAPIHADDQIAEGRPNLDGLPIDLAGIEAGIGGRADRRVINRNG
jgi:hypothetical protein